MNDRQRTLGGKIIAFFHQSADLYGSDRILLDLAEGVKQAGGHAVVVLPDTGPLTTDLERLGIEFHVLPILKLYRGRLSATGLMSLLRESMSVMKAYDRAFANRRVAVVHSNTLAVLGGALWARRRRIPHLWHVHEIVEHPWIAGKGFPRLVSRLADRVVCNSKATSNWLLAAQPRLRARTSVILNGVRAPQNLDDAAVARFRAIFRPGGERLAVGLIGRINRLKGHSLLLDAVDRLHEQGITDFSLVFVGSPPPGQEFYLAQLKERITRSPARARIVVQGFMPDIWPAYAALDMVCVPSTEPESFGLVAAEAMSLGKLVLASRLGALIELIEDRETGVGFWPVTADALAIALHMALADDDFRGKAGEAGRRRVESEFSLSSMTERFIATYLELSPRKT